MKTIMSGSLILISENIILRYGGGLDEDNNPITGGESKNGFCSPFAVNVYIIENDEGVQVAQIDDVDIIECV